MAAQSESPARWRKPFQSWLDGIEAGWAIPLLLIGFVAVWLAFLIIAYINGDLAPDVLETWWAGRSLEWGYAGHAPLAPWVAHAWTTFFPLSNWSFQLLALTNSAIALWAVDLITRRFVEGDKRMVVLLLLMLLPIYQFYGQRFDADTVLLAAWPIATYCFLRSFEAGQIGWAIAAGATAALAILGQYSSAFLIFSFVFAAICHPQRGAYFRTAAPWISVGVAAAVLAPHLYWLATTGVHPFADALRPLTDETSGSSSRIAALLLLLLLVLVLAIPIVKWSRVEGDRYQQFSEAVNAVNPGLLLLFLITVGTIVFPAIAAAALGTGVTPALRLEGLFLLAFLIVCGADYQIERSYSVNLAALVVGMAAMFVLVVAPLHARYRSYSPLPDGRNYYQSSAAELTRRWHAQSDQPLPAVGGDDHLALAAAFYSPDHPEYDKRLVLPNVERLASEAALERGWASLCFDGDTGCIAAMAGAAARASRFVRSEFTVESKLLGLSGDKQRFAALIVPPSNSAPPSMAVPPPDTASPPVAATPPAAAPPSVAETPSATAPASVAESPSVTAPPSIAETPSVTTPPSVAETPSVPPPPPSVAETPAVAAPPSIAEAPPVTAPPSVAGTPSVPPPPSVAETPPVTAPPSVAETPPEEAAPSVAETPSVTAPPSIAEMPPVAPPPAVAETPAVTAPPAVGETAAATPPAAVAETTPAPPPPSVAALPPAAPTSAPPLAGGSAEELAEGATARVQKVLPSVRCCAPAPSRPEVAERQSEVPLPAVILTKESGSKRAAHATPPIVDKVDRVATSEYLVNWARWAATQRAAGACRTGSGLSGWKNPCCQSCWSAARFATVRWRAGSPGCRGSGRGCSSSPPVMASTASGRSRARTALSTCGGGRRNSSSHPGDGRVGLAKWFSTLVADLDARLRCGGSVAGGHSPGGWRKAKIRNAPHLRSASRNVDDALASR
jgi:4-amino-4-deoxy-L-arabinose transferase-like glycosyltransferase